LATSVGEVVLLLLEALAELEAREAADLDVLADLGDQLLLELLDRLVGVLHERLVEEADVLQPLRELALDHLLRRPASGLPDSWTGLGDPAPRARGRWRRRRPRRLRTKSGPIAATCSATSLVNADEVVVARDEVGLAVDLDQHADAAAAVDVRHHGALGGLAAGLLGGLGEALGAEVVDRLLGMSASVSTSAFLQSAMPAPVRSRRSLIIVAVTSAMTSLLNAEAALDGGCRS
jgi:hypothetical protein